MSARTNFSSSFLLASLLTALAGSAYAATEEEGSHGVLRLEDAERTAAQHQPALLQAKALTEAARGRAEQARSGFFPQVTATASYQRIHGARPATTGAAPGVPVTATTPAGTTFDFFSFGVSGSQLICDFGQTIDKSRAASASIDSSEASQRTSEFQTILQVRHAFFQARAEKALVIVAKDTVTNQERHMKQIEGFVRMGTRPEIDLAKARTDLATFRLNLVNASNGYVVAKAQLNQAMGVIASADYDVADDDIAPVEGEEGSIEQLVETALAARPEVATLARQHDAQELTAQSLRGGYAPTLSATGGVSETGTALDALGNNWNVGAVLSWPLFQGGLTRGQVREAEANAGATTAALEQERLTIRFEVEQAALNVRAAKIAIGAADEAVTNAKEQLRLAEARYESGVGSIIELGDAQLAFTNAAALRVQAAYTLASARADLRSAVGRS